MSNPTFVAYRDKAARFKALRVGAGTPAERQAARADTTGATLAALETEVNALKAVLRAFGLIAS